MMELVVEAHGNMRQVVESALPSSGTQAPVLLDGSVGRPRFDIRCSQLEHLVQAHFSCPQMASILGLSVSNH